MEESLNRISRPPAYVSGGNLKGYVDEEDEITSPSFAPEEPTSSSWTDEKHSLYLDSMEASFVNQLYNMPSSRSHHRNKQVSSSLFKVLRNNCWEVLELERSTPVPDIDVDESDHVLMNNQWVRHFRPAHKPQDMKSVHRKDKNPLGIESAAHLRQKKNRHSRSNFCHQISTSSNAEVSDQNFLDDEGPHEAEEKHEDGG